MSRRYASSGRFRSPPPMQNIPLFEAAFAHPVKSRPHCAAEATKRASRRAIVMAAAEVLRAECAGERVVF